MDRGNLLSSVDFPAFVAGLIQGTFKAAIAVTVAQTRAFRAAAHGAGETGRTAAAGVRAVGAAIRPCRRR